jgi:hypothetical protein
MISGLQKSKASYCKWLASIESNYYITCNTRTAYSRLIGKVYSY